MLYLDQGFYKPQDIDTSTAFCSIHHNAADTVVDEDGDTTLKVSITMQYIREDGAVLGGEALSLGLYYSPENKMQSFVESINGAVEAMGNHLAFDDAERMALRSALNTFAYKQLGGL